MADTEQEVNQEISAVQDEEDARPLTEKEFIKEQLRLRRMRWIRDHRTLLYTAVGILLVVIIFLFIRVYSAGSDPLNRLVQSCVKDFGTSFDFTVTLSEDNEPSMRYKGTLECDRNTQSLQSSYQADYGSYTYSAAVWADNGQAAKGSFYQEKWVIDDCSEQIRDFFTLDKSVKNGDLDAGALLRFLGMTSDFSSEELDRFSGAFTKRLVSDKNIAVIKASPDQAGTRYDYDIDLGALFRLIVDDGAPIFFHSSDYNIFAERYEANKRNIEASACRMSYLIDAQGYLTNFRLEVDTDGTLYTLDCTMSNFGEAKANLPEAFVQAATVTVEEE